MILLSISGIRAQEEYRMEIGGMGGGSFYMGDANTTAFFKNMEMAFGAIWRYNFNPRYGIKANMVYGKISGDTRDVSNAFPLEKEVAFNKSLFDLGGQFEYNFNGYGYKVRGTKRFSPYIFAGLGISFATGEKSNAFGLNIPFGAGVKYKIAPRLNIGLEFSMRKTFSDELDGVKKDDALYLKDPYGVKSSWLKNKDWYSFTLFFVSYDFMARTRNCNN